MVLGRLKSGSVSPTFRLVCGAVGGVAGFCGVVVGVGADCAAATAAVAASKKIKPRTFRIMGMTPLPGFLPTASRGSRKQAEFTSGLALAQRCFAESAPISRLSLLAIKTQEFLKSAQDNGNTLKYAGSGRKESHGGEELAMNKDELIHDKISIPDDVPRTSRPRLLNLVLASMKAHNSTGTHGRAGTGK